MLNNVVVNVLSREHGGKVIEAFKSLGVDTRTLSGAVNVQERGIHTYYGIVDSYFDNYSFGEVNKKNINILTLEELLNYNKQFPREMYVWNYYNKEEKKKRIVLCKLPKGKEFSYLCVTDSSRKNFEQGEDYCTVAYKNAEDIVVEEMTLAQVCKALGKEIKIVKE